MSTSPDSSAATRVASAWMGVKTTSVRLCSFLPHQASFGRSTVFMPIWREPTLKGPVPLELLVAKFSTLFLTLAGCPRFAHDIARGDLEAQDRVRLVHDEIDGKVVDLLDLLHHPDGVAHVGAVCLHALDAECDVLRASPLWNLTLGRR